MIDFDDRLLSFATERQREYLEAWREHGSMRAAADAMGVHWRNIIQAKERVQKKAALQGFSPDHDMVHPVPEGFVVKGVSTYYNDDGKPTARCG